MRTLRRRPQIPRRRDYVRRGVRVATNDSSVSLSGELTLPGEDRLYPGVVLLTGSGQHTRDEHVAGHPWFLVLSDHLTRNGFAVLRCDDRGVGRSTGDFQQATLEDYATDAVEMIAFLRTQPNVDPDCCGLIGHSEGGMTAPLAATKTRVDFIVALAGPALPLMPDTLARQYEDILRLEGKPETIVETAVQQVIAGTEILRSAGSLEEARSALVRYLEGEGMSKRAIKQNVEFWARPWGMHHARYDLRPALEQYAGPMLALFGGSDLQVHAASHAPEMESRLRQERSRVKTFPDHNHLFQRSTSGRIMEYFSIRTTIEGEVLDEVAQWMREIVDG